MTELNLNNIIPLLLDDGLFGYYDLEWQSIRQECPPILRECPSTLIDPNYKAGDGKSIIISEFTWIQLKKLAKLTALLIDQLTDRNEIIFNQAGELAHQNEIITSLTEKIEALELKLAEPRLNSGNSGLSSSIDITGGPAKSNCGNGQSGAGEENPQPRKQGGQKGHPGSNRPPLTEAEATDVVVHDLEDKSCRNCGHTLVRDPDRDRQIDRLDIPLVMVKKIMHVIKAYRCPNCGRYHYGDIPKDVLNAGLISYSFISMFVMMKGRIGMSMRNIQELCRIVYNEKFSLGFINKQLKFASEALLPIYLELVDNMKNVPVLNIDETGHKNQGQRSYTWVFCGKQSIIFKIGTRSTYILEVVLGDNYEGVIGADFFTSYRAFAKDKPDITLQFCLAHLIRDFKYCQEFNLEEAKTYGKTALKLLKDLFDGYHKYVTIQDKNSPQAKELMEQLLILKGEITKVALDAPSKCKKAMGIAQRFRDYPDEYFTFLENPNVDPTNNLAEQNCRTAVLARKISYGTQSLDGVMFCEVIWSLFATMKANKLDFWSFLIEALQAHSDGKPLPSLVNIGSTVDPKFNDFATKEIEEMKSTKKQLASMPKPDKDAKRKKSKRRKASATEEKDSKSPPESTPEKQPQSGQNASPDENNSNKDVNSEDPCGPQKPPDESPITPTVTKATDLSAADAEKECPKSIPSPVDAIEPLISPSMKASIKAFIGDFIADNRTRASRSNIRDRKAPEPVRKALEPAPVGPTYSL
jgi:transposase